METKKTTSQTPERSLEWWEKAIADRCAEHAKLMQHCLISCAKEIMACRRPVEISPLSEDEQILQQIIEDLKTRP